MSSRILVDEIYGKTANTSALTIDSSGRILQPAKPAFSVYSSQDLADANYTSAVSDAPCFSTTDFNIGSCVAISSGIATFTAPVDGLYQFNWCLVLNNTTTVGHASSYLYIYEGGSTLRYSSEDHRYRNLQDAGHNDSDTNYYSLPNSALVQLSATDTAKVMIKIYNDSSVGIRSGSRFSGYLVG